MNYNKNKSTQHRERKLSSVFDGSTDAGKGREREKQRSVRTVTQHALLLNYAYKFGIK